MNFMKRKIHFKIILLIYAFYSCSYSQKDIVEKTFYPDTKTIRSKRIFKSIEDKKNNTFSMSEFDSLGNIIFSFYLKDSVLNGPFFEYFPNGVVKYSANYSNGVENGISIYNNEKGHLITEALIINGAPIIVKNFSVFHLSKTKGYSIFLVKNDTIVETEGEIIYDSLLNQIIDTSTFYYNVNRITEVYNEGECLKVSLLGTKHQNFNTNINLFLGELSVENFSNDRYSLKDTVGIIKSDKNEIKLNCNKYNFKNDLITGLLQLELYSLDGKEKIRDKYFTFYYDLKSD